MNQEGPLPITQNELTLDADRRRSFFLVCWLSWLDSLRLSLQTWQVVWMKWKQAVYSHDGLLLSSLITNLAMLVFGGCIGIAFWTAVCWQSYASPFVMNSAQWLTILSFDGMILLPIMFIRATSEYRLIMLYWILSDLLGSCMLVIFAGIVWVYGSPNIDQHCYPIPNLAWIAIPCILALQWLSFLGGLTDLIIFDRLKLGYSRARFTFVQSALAQMRQTQPSAVDPEANQSQPISQ